MIEQLWNNSNKLFNLQDLTDANVSQNGGADQGGEEIVGNTNDPKLFIKIQYCGG